MPNVKISFPRLQNVDQTKFRYEELGDFLDLQEMSEESFSEIVFLTFEWFQPTIIQLFLCQYQLSANE